MSYQKKHAAFVESMECLPVAQLPEGPDPTGQAPVLRPGHAEIYEHAVSCIERAETAKLLLSKGGSQGKTPKEFCINTDFLPAVKRAITARDLSSLRDEPRLNALMDFIDKGPQTAVVIGAVIVSEKVLAECREPAKSGSSR